MAGYVASGRLGSSGEPVLVQQPAETVNPLDNVPTFELRQRQVGDRRFEVDAAVRALLVVVGQNSRSTRSAWRSLRMSTQSRHSARGQDGEARRDIGETFPAFASHELGRFEVGAGYVQAGGGFRRPSS
jgi:hypothetical protein